MKFKLEFSVDNDAFAPSFSTRVGEITEVFNSVLHKLMHGEDSGTIRDSNGNTIGQFKFTAR